jgi:hypothetical protein
LSKNAEFALDHKRGKGRLVLTERYLVVGGEFEDDIDDPVFFVDPAYVERDVIEPITLAPRDVAVSEDVLHVSGLSLEGPFLNMAQPLVTGRRALVHREWIVVVGSGLAGLV